MGTGTHRLSLLCAKRFAASWNAIAPSGKIGLAVSGGPDSLALLLLYHEVVQRNFCVVTVDHGLRPESAAEATMVSGLCAERGIAHTTLSLSLAKGSGVQARARAARYTAMAQWAHELGLAAIATAHHADDQTETMVMRLNRGAGLRGLAGMRPVVPLPFAPRHIPLMLVRPLLQWSRSDLVDVVEAARIIPVDDPSNHDPLYERVRIRQAISSTQVLQTKGFCETAHHLAEADIALEWAADQLWLDVSRDAEGLKWNAPADTPGVLALRILERVLLEFGAPVPRGSELVRWLETLRSAKVSTLGGVKGDARFGAWHFTRAPDRRT